MFFHYLQLKIGKNSNVYCLLNKNPQKIDCKFLEKQYNIFLYVNKENDNEFSSFQKCRLSSNILSVSQILSKVIEIQETATC